VYLVGELGYEHDTAHVEKSDAEQAAIEASNHEGDRLVCVLNADDDVLCVAIDG